MTAPCAAVGPYPFRDHRTVAEIDGAERAQQAARARHAVPAKERAA